jgi:hypothetical protein
VSVLSGAIGFTIGAVLWSPQALAADPTNADCVAANEAALKSGNEHHLRADRNELLVCSSVNCPTDIRLECVRRVDEVNAAIPTIIFEAKDAAGGDLSAVKVTMDGEVLAERLEGTALSIDPGEHTFVFETDGQSPLTKTFVIHESQKDRREAITFGSAAPGPVSQALPPAPTVIAEPMHGLGTQKIVAIVAAGVGVVGLGIGTAFGIMALSKKSDAQSACPSAQCANQADANKWSDAASTGNVSTAGFIVGAAGVAGGVVLWLTAKRASESAPAPSAQVGLGMGTIQVRGQW